MKVFDSAPLKELIHATLEKGGVCKDSCFHVSESVVLTSLRGTDSHGITLFPHYNTVALSGRINKTPKFSYERQSPSIALFDADAAFGHHAGVKAMELAMDMAAETGIGAVSVRNSSHFGAAQYFARLAPPRDMLGLSFTNAPTSVLAYSSTKPFFGTNPICLLAPMLNEEPFCLDMATSSMPSNKLLNHKRTGEPIRPDMVFDENGMTTTDPSKACYLGPYGGYKGFGLGMMVDIFCGMLAGGPLATEMTNMYKELGSSRNLSQFFMAIDIARFQDPLVFKTRLQQFADTIRALPRAEGALPVMIPGDPEKKCLAERLVSGIPVDDPMYEKFLTIDPAFAAAAKA